MRHSEDPHGIHRQIASAEVAFAKPSGEGHVERKRSCTQPFVSRVDSRPADISARSVVLRVFC